MLPELGQVALVLALILAIVQGVLPLIGAWRNSAPLMAVARPAAAGQAVFITLAIAILGYAFLTFDFSVLYVAQNSNLKLPWYYRLSAVWGAHEGSLLLWIFILNVWSLALAFFTGRMPPRFAARVLSVMGLVSVGFLLFTIFTSNPFTRLIPAPMDGADLNPLLQDPGMTFHPPILYMGYVGFSVAFAFSIAALLGGHLEKQWVRWARPWTNIAWAFLTLGIVAGSWWAYKELGWGGWWFWDPVENGSFMPWLLGAALVHSQAVTEKRGSMRAWTILLSIFTFSLSLLGTFIVRSGLLTSVHAFASDPKRGVYILIFLTIVVGGSLLLYALRASKVASGKGFAPLSRETVVLVANLALTTSAAMVLLGTIFPIIGEALGLGRISVGPPYFGPLFILLMLPGIALMPFGPFARWGRADKKELLRVFIHCAVFALIIAGISIIAFWRGSVDHGKLIVGSLGAAYVIRGVIMYALKRWKTTAPGRRFPPEMAGMLLAHLGVGIFLAGSLMSQALSVQRDIRMDPNQSQTVGGYQFEFKGVEHAIGPNWTADEATLVVTNKKGKTITTLKPQKRTYSQGEIQTEAAIKPGIFSDLYAALGEHLDNGAWSLRIYYKPFVHWIWAGGLFMVLGGFIAAADKRYRLRREVTEKTHASARPQPLGNNSSQEATS